MSGAPGVLEIWGEGLLIFRELGSTGNYFQRLGEQAHNLGDLGSLAHKVKNKLKKNLREKTFISFDFLKKIFGFCGRAPPPPLSPLRKS